MNPVSIQLLAVLYPRGSFFFLVLLIHLLQEGTLYKYIWSSLIGGTQQISWKG